MEACFDNTKVGTSSIVLSFEIPSITPTSEGDDYDVSVDITILPTEKLAELNALLEQASSHTEGNIEEVAAAIYRDVKAFYQGKGYGSKVEVIVTAKDFLGYGFVRVHHAG